MKKLKSIRAVTRSILLLLTMFLFLIPHQLKAQTNYYSPVSNTLFGTSDSRLTATVKQEGNKITMTVGAVGTLVADVFEFNVLFNPDALTITDTLFNPITDKGTASVYPSIFKAIRLEPALKDKSFSVSKSTAIRGGNSLIAGGTGLATMHSIDAQVHNVEIVGNTKIEINSKDFVPLYTVFFTKTTTDPLDPADIGFNIRSATGLHRAIRWLYEGGSVSYSNTFIDDEKVNRNLFSYRSPSSVQTRTVENVFEGTATLNGTFKRGELPPAYNLMDSVASTPRYTGKLLNDTIVRYGFFYTESNIAEITHSEYSTLLTIAGTQYSFPTDIMISQGYFVAGTDTIKIVVSGTSSNAFSEEYDDVITGLKPNTTYNVWAFAQYIFETSKPYPLVGAKQTFTTSQILNIASTFVAKDPTCEASNGEIQISVIGGSGQFQYSLDGVNYKDYPNGLIDGLSAGTYRVYVRDANDTLYPAAISAEIALRNVESHLFVNVAATNASDCILKDGILHVSAGGGLTPYNYTLNGEPVEVVNGQIADRKAGVYVLNVTDALGCTATTGEVRIASATSMLDLIVENTSNTQCNENTGSVRFRVENSSYYKYQLDGMSVVTSTTNAPIVLSNLNAGVHTLRVFDTCGLEKSEEFFIYNNDENGFLATVAVENIKVACNNSATAGKIILTAANGAPVFKYTLDGSEWKYFPAGSNTVTIDNLTEGTYYIQVADTNGIGCTYEINSITIGRETTPPLNVLASYASKEPDCNQPNGQIQVYATGGSGTYKYSVNGGAFQSYSNGLITGLSAGTYKIRVQDANDLNCTVAQGGEVVLHNSNTNLELAVVPVNASTCATNAGDGKLYVSVSGGSKDYTYTWGNGTTATVTDGKIENLPVGVYVLNVKDNESNCVATSGEVRITSNASTLAVAIMDETSTVCGSSVGTATFKVTGSTSYKYQLDGMAIMTATHNNPIVLTDLNAGVHVLRVFDDCAEISKQIFISNGENGLAFTKDVENVKVACNGDLEDGTIFITVSNGAPDFVCFINGVQKNFATGENTLSVAVKEGVHYVRVEDNTGCSYEWNSIVVGREKIPLVDIGTIYAAKDPTCNNTNGEIQVYATGGSGTYKYSYDGVNYNNYTNGLITGLGAGTYRIYVKDAKYFDCAPAISADVTLNNTNNDFAIFVSTDSASTCLSNDGSLYVSVSGGSGNYSYKLNDGTTTAPVNGKYTKPAGLYVVEVKDLTSNCTVSSEEIRIYSRESTLDFAVNDVTHTICKASIGAIEFTVSGATSYNYQLDGMPVVAMTNNDPITLNGLSAGVHTLRVFNNCGEVSKQVTINNGTNALAFTAEVNNSGCATTPEERSITLTVTGGTAPFQYSLNNGKTWSTPTSSTTIVTNEPLLTGTYDVLLRDNAGCEYEYTQIRIDENGTVIAPFAMTPQTFCTGATVANLQATGVGIKWYSTLHGGLALDPSTVLEADKIYYAVQTIGTCESQSRTAVKALINDDVILDAPAIAYNQSFCKTSSTLTLADIATNGNTNIVWYNQAVGGSVLSINTPLENDTYYYAAQAAGSCQSAIRAEVLVTIGTTPPAAINVTTPQYFCKGALVGNIAVPNNQIVWYSASTGGTPLTAGTALQNGETYYAAYKSGDCESASRIPVEIYLTAPLAPIAPPVQTICGYKTTVADLTVEGSGIVWYATEDATTPLSPSTLLVVGKDYYAAQTSLGCEGARVPVRITDVCFTLKGTVFPFVHTGNQEFDTLFPVMVKLYSYPTTLDCDDPLSAIIHQTPIAITKASYHNGIAEWIPNTPKNPGTVGAFNNPGLPIDWAKVTETSGTVDGRLLVVGESPNITAPGASIGKYALDNIPPAQYLLVISRQGFVTRIGKLTVTDDANLGHRELVAGDVNSDYIVNSADASAIKPRFADKDNPIYNPKYDMNGDGEVNSEDLEYIKNNNSATFMIYDETMEWLLEVCQ